LKNISKIRLWEIYPHHPLIIMPQIVSLNFNQMTNIKVFIYNLEIEILKVVKIQNQPFKTPDIQLFKTALYETETNTLLELPSLALSTKNTSNITQNEVCI
jgi:hypothetical protein